MYKLSFCFGFVLILLFSNFKFQQDDASKPFKDKVGLFDSEEVLAITIRGNLKGLLNDRTGVPADFPMELSYQMEDKSIKSLPVVMKTRGHFRRIKENCKYPPLLIQFTDQSDHKKTIFGQQKKLKLVVPCSGDEYIIKEYMAYKMYQLITPMSFKARLVQVTLEDEKNKKPPVPFYGMLLEEENQMAERNQVVAFEKKLQPQQTQLKPFLTVAVFEYLIGNTDWSVQYQQNIKLIATDSNAMPIVVPYDFDHAGIVQAPYAHPAPELQLTNTRERRYRGYCIQSLSAFDEILATYKAIKPQLYALYTSNTLLDEKYIKSTIKFLDEFYTTIDNPKLLQKALLYPCDKNGTGNVVIKGLRQD